MEKNMGSADRSIRLVAGVVLLALGVFDLISKYMFSHKIALVLIVLGVVMLATSSISFCPLYLPFKIKTTGKKKALHYI